VHALVEGKNSGNGPEEAYRRLKPLAQIAVYTVTEAERAKENE
jgi:hypothetical protein